MLTELVHQALKKKRHLDNMWTIWSCRKRESQLESHSFHADISQQPHPAVSSPLQSRSRQCDNVVLSIKIGTILDIALHFLTRHARKLQCFNVIHPLHKSSQAKEVAEIYRSLAWRYNFLHVNLQVSASTTWQQGFLHPIPISTNAFRMLCWIQCPLCALTLFVLQYVHIIFSYIPYRSLYIIYTYFFPDVLLYSLASSCRPELLHITFMRSHHQWRTEQNES